MPPTPSVESYLNQGQRVTSTGRQERVTLNESVYQVITDRIVHLLEQGTIPWQKPWKSSDQAPQNFVSRKPYRGVNVFLLNCLGYASPYFLTFKQAQQLGGFVKKGEKGCPVVFWKWLEVEDKETHESKRIPFLRYFSVFNVTQCENIPAPNEETILSPAPAPSPIEAAEEIVQGMPQRPEIKSGLDRAFYSPRQDYVGMPAVQQFKGGEEYYSTLFHELTHATGHDSRLNRKGVSRSEGTLASFGSDPYAREELVAEMGSAFLCGEAGIVDRVIDNSAAYVASWLERLKNDSKLVVTAAAQAQKAADFILGKFQSEASEGTDQN